jgi:predicted dehydrogenase
MKITQRLNIPIGSIDWEETIKNPELQVVSIATPPALHKDMVLSSFNNGKHVICEKPLALNVEEAEQMVDAADESGLVAMLDLDFRYIPSKLHFMELIKSRYIGDIYDFDVTVRTSSRLNPRQRGYNWWSDKKQGGGMLNALGSHYIDYIYMIFDEIKGVMGKTSINIKSRLNKKSSKMKKVTADDAFSAQFDLGNDTLCSMKLSATSPYGRGSRVEAFGSEGALVLMENNQVYGGKIGEDKELKHIPLPTKYQTLNGDKEHYLIPAFKALLNDFANGVTRGSSPHPNLHDGLKIQKCIDAIIESQKKNKWIYIK